MNRRGRSLGLDELMIVNPSFGCGDVCVLGDDGTLYRIEGMNDTEDARALGPLFLGDDGTVYEVVRRHGRRGTTQ